MGQSDSDFQNQVGFRYCYSGALSEKDKGRRIIACSILAAGMFFKNVGRD